MDSVLRAAALYLVLLVLFRIAGRRSLTDITTFDLLLLRSSAKPPSRRCWATTSRWSTRYW